MLPRPSKFFGGARSPRTLGVERSTVAYTTPHELRPIRHAGGSRLDLLGKQRPKLRLIPAERITGAVAMSANRRTEFFDLGKERVARKRV